ncbi:MATE family efflux transporter [Novosphingobium cyanobacteriorum]|uniref:MATE family efflux transporter n=1 Tax=Novosphingobium cyanobacteriorum TaxID=3024215 RepID=A0ABT6CFM1_9SPHN|nr:MATE family efflux transporter [Novosphingobium cyanobacteriorum]MDF8332724.1 MATE family efflux transporter [Novosphingobium cyanobacteriorum]
MDAPASAAPRSHHRDLTKGPILRTLLVFSAPTLASNILQSLNGSVNSVWVGQLLGESALAATANANVVMFLVFAAVFGFGMAATVKVGQAFGAGNVDAARRTFGSAIGFCVGLSMVVAAAGWLGAPALLRAMSTPGDVFGFALAYLRVIFVAMPASMITVMLGMGLRGAGDAQTSLRFMILSVVLDVALNPLLIAGIGPFPRLGIAGAALATALASYVSMIALVLYVYARNLPLRLRGAELHYLIPARAELRYIVTKGLPMGAQMLLISMAGIIMIGLVNREGALVSAAYGASLQVWTYLQMPAMAISAALSAMAAQAIGAGLSGRLGQITRAGLILNTAITGAMTLLLLAFDRPVLELFLGQGSPSVDLARHIQFIASWSFVLFGVTIVLFGTMRAGGVVIAPLVVLAIAMYPGRIGFYWLAHPTLGADAIWLAFPIGSLIAATLATVAYRRPGWREKARAVDEDECAEETRADGDCAGRMSPSL